MFDTVIPDHPAAAQDHVRSSEADLASRLPADGGSPESPPDFWGGPDAYWQLVHALRLTLPPPLGDTAEDLLRRDRAAIARIAALVPANAAEADVAAQFVAASEQWKDCLRLAQASETTPDWARKCRAQAVTMMRQANAALRLLLRMQAAREKREAHQVTCDRAAWTEHCALGFMAEALACPPPGPLPRGKGAEQPSPSGRGSGEGAAGQAAAAERAAAADPERAGRMRRAGGLPRNVRYLDPPEPALGRVLMPREAGAA